VLQEKSVRETEGVGDPDPSRWATDARLDQGKKKSSVRSTRRGTDEPGDVGNGDVGHRPGWTAGERKRKEKSDVHEASYRPRCTEAVEGGPLIESRRGVRPPTALGEGVL